MSPRRCTICDHPARVEADHLLRDERGDAEVARLLGDVSEDAIRRHRLHHLRSGNGETPAHSPQVQELLSECDRLAEMAADDTRGSIQLLAQRIRLLEVAARAPVQQQQAGENFVRKGSIAFIDEMVRFAQRFGLSGNFERMFAALSRIASECPRCSPLAQQALTPLEAETTTDAEQESTHVTN
jgi:hypothetical protein